MQLWVERLWHQPAVFVLHNFVSAAEAERMIRHAAAVRAEWNAAVRQPKRSSRAVRMALRAKRRRTHGTARRG
jgi:hypothetical protein